MFGMGFFEIMLVLIVAIIALGPEKLPGAAVEMVKFFKKFKSGIEEAKSTIDNELNLSEMKKEADNFKASISDVTSSVDDVTSSINSSMDDIGESLNPDYDTVEQKPRKSAAELHREQTQKEANRYKEEAAAAREQAAAEQTVKKENISFDQGKA